MSVSERAHDCGGCAPTVGANQFGVTIANYSALATVGGVAVVRTSPPIALARTVKARTDLSFVIVNLT